MVTTPTGPEFVKNTDQSGAKSGDHTQLSELKVRGRQATVTTVAASDGSARRCHIVWRNGKRIGVTFDD